MGDPVTMAAVASIGSVGLSAGGDILKGYGEKQGQDFEAAKAERAAQFGRVKADQTDVQLREQLQTTLSNIDAVRVAANTDPLSPTGLAIADEETRVADRERRLRTGSLRMQADEDDATAGYRRYAGKMALIGGVVSAGSKVARSLGGKG